MEAKKKNRPEKYAAAEYLTDFRENVKNLNIIYAQYYNIITTVSHKYGSDSKNSDSENLQIINSCDQLRLHINIIHIQYLSLHATTKLETEDTDYIEKLHMELLKDYIIKLDNVKKYIIEINKFLCTRIIDKLLKGADDILMDVYTE